MTDIQVTFDPPETVPLAQLEVGDYVTRIDRIELRPEKKVTAIHRPLHWGNSWVGLWGFGLINGESVTAQGDGCTLTADRLSRAEAARRNHMAAAMDTYTRPDGTIGRVGKLIV